MNKAIIDAPDTSDNFTKPEWAMSRREKINAERIAEGLPLRRRRWPWVVLVLLLIGGGAGYFAMINQPSGDKPAAEQIAAEPVMQVNQMEYAAMAPRLLERLVKVTGTMSPSRQAQISAQTGGRVDTINVRPGDAVSAGDVLLQIDVENLTLQLQQVRSTAAASRTNLAQAENQLQRTEELSRRGIASSSALEQARSAVDAQKASLAALDSQIATAEIALRHATVRAPFDGIVATRNIDPGQVIAAGTPLMTMVDLSVLELEGNAPIGSGALVEVGQKVRVEVDGIAGRVFEGTIDRINPVATSGSRTIPVYIRIDNGDGRLRGGMFTTGEVVVDTRQDALAVPVDAIREDAKGSYVLRIAEGRLERADIEKGATWNGGRLVNVRSGLDAGDKIVIATLPELKPGDAVEIVGD